MEAEQLPEERREKEIIVRYLTKDPKLSAAQEQMKIVNLLTNTDRELFEEALELWHEKNRTKCTHTTNTIDGHFVNLKNKLKNHKY